MNLKNVIHYGILAVVGVVGLGLLLCVFKLSDYEATNFKSRKSYELSFIAKAVYAEGLQMELATRNIILDPTGTVAYKNHDIAKNAFLEAIDQFGKSSTLVPNGREWQDKIDSVSKIFDHDIEVQHEIHALVRAGKQADAVKRLNDEETPLWRDERTIILDVAKKTREAAEVMTVKADQAASDMKHYMLAIGLLMALIPMGIYVLSTRLVKLLREQVARLVRTSDSATQMSDDLAGTSEGISESLQEQSVALQETSSSSDEISAMVHKNTENSQKATSLAEQSRRTADDGKHAMEQMVSAIETIRQSEETLVGEIKTSHEEISGIIRLINEIVEKTKVINDIVFQTKLLSFNASVEAARAGEHGKGFAVVAEEVGNLAQMSGNASKEITELLGRSTSQVEEIIRNSKAKVEAMFSSCADRSTQGVETAKRCATALEKIVQNISQMDTMIAEIKVSSMEQASGVGQITTAVHQMNQFMQSSSASMSNASHAANRLKAEAVEVKDVVQKVELLLDGAERAPSESVKEAEPAPQRAGLKAA